MWGVGGRGRAAGERTTLLVDFIRYVSLSDVFIIRESLKNIEKTVTCVTPWSDPLPTVLSQKLNLPLKNPSPSYTTQFWGNCFSNPHNLDL